MISFAALDTKNKGEYLKLLSAISKLSGLFSESSVPYINYRVAENIFCRSFGAHNLSRSDTAFDANYNSIGIGLKTFVCNSNSSTEKIAEFNSLSRDLANYKGKKLAIKLAEYRNDRIDLAKRLYNLDSSIYHIIARKDSKLVLFETDYDNIDIANIKILKETKSGLQFEDGINSYNFNFSKNTLFRRFYLPQNAFNFPVEILKDPYDLLLNIFEDLELEATTNKLIRGKDFIVLPLYGIKKGEKFVFEKSGLNQWNAGGRKRDFGEVYIPIPIKIHQLFPDFFPNRDELFKLKIPTGEIFTAKVCQENSKALMTNPNKALSDWLLRKILLLKEGELATIDKLNNLGFDSVIILKDKNGNYEIDKGSSNSYEDFISNENFIIN